MESNVVSGEIHIGRIRVAGTIQLPLEPRVAVVVALELFNADGSHRWIEFMVAGCHTELGFR